MAKRLKASFKKKLHKEVHHSGSSSTRSGKGSVHTYAQSDNHDAPNTGSSMIFYPAQGN